MTTWRITEMVTESEGWTLTVEEDGESSLPGARRFGLRAQMGVVVLKGLAHGTLREAQDAAFLMVREFLLGADG